MIQLSKNENVSLSKTNPDLSIITVGFGWKILTTDDTNIDLNPVALLLNADNKLDFRENAIFFRFPLSIGTDVGLIDKEDRIDRMLNIKKGDKEAIKINLTTLSPDIKKILFVVSLDEDDITQSFEQISRAHIRIINDSDRSEIVRFNVNEDIDNSKSILLGELYRHNDEWYFRALGQGLNKGLNELLKNYNSEEPSVENQLPDEDDTEYFCPK